MTIGVDCDMGESFGLYRMGNDARLKPHIALANVGGGFHAAAPSVIVRTMALAHQHGVKIDADTSLPDL